MEKKPSLIYLLIVIWAVICFLFLGLLVVDISNYLEQSETMNQDSPFNTANNLNFIIFLILFLLIIISSFLLAFGTIFKKNWSWLFGMMFSSFLGFYVFFGIIAIGTAIIMGYFDIFETPYSVFSYVTSFAVIILVPILLFILTRQSVKTYFEKEQKQLIETNKI